MPRPERQVRVSLPAGLWRALQLQAAREGLTVDDLLQRAVASDVSVAAGKSAKTMPGAKTRRASRGQRP